MPGKTPPMDLKRLCLRCFRSFLCLLISRATKVSREAYCDFRKERMTPVVQKMVWQAAAERGDDHRAA